MPRVIEVTEDDIAYAESILLSEGEIFDEERREFISNWKTIDLQAVPGSGKTTALLAKLLIIDRKLPFEDGSGVLVISHTNAAIDEIKERIQKHCSHLFSEPNFIGTIQSFVDKFIAIPFYNNKYKGKVFRIDDDTYKRAHHVPRLAQAWMRNQGQDAMSVLVKIKLQADGTLAPLPTRFPNPETDTAQAILSLKKDIREKGYLSFEEAFILAFEALDIYPAITRLLRERFKFVFIDEVQDMDTNQYLILERLFFEPGVTDCIFQRIGDKNQSIFNNTDSANNAWRDRDEVLELNGSHRLTQNLAEIIEPFGSQQIAIIGRRKHPDGRDINIKPHILLFSDDTVRDVIPKFAELVRGFQIAGEIPISLRNTYKAIGWTTQSEDGKVRLDSYYPAFSKGSRTPKLNCDTLDAYLCNTPNKERSLEPFKRNILDSLLHVLRLEGVSNETGKPYTKRSLLRFLEENFPDEYDDLRLKISEWSFSLAKGSRPLVLTSIQDYIPTFLTMFESTVDKCRTFIDTPFTGVPLFSVQTEVQPNLYRDPNGVAVEIATVHSAKGQTHTATLYLETDYQHQHRNGTAYESQRLADQFKGGAFADTRVYHRQSTKMMYVGLSRPTHLLCVAIHEDRFNAHITNVDPEKWEVIHIRP